VGRQVNSLRRLALIVALTLACAILPTPALGAPPGITIPPKIDHAAKTITFEVKLFLYPACAYPPNCPVTQKIVEDISSNINDAWNNGLKFKCYTIVIDLRITRGDSRDGLVDEVGARIDVSPAPIQSQVSTVDGGPWDASGPSDRSLPTNDGQTIWGSPPMSANTYAHEFGHVLGLDDGYTEVNGDAVDRPGAPLDLMNSGMHESNAISQETIDRLIGRAGITESDLHCDLGWNVTIVWTDVYDGIFDTITFDGIVDTVPLGPEYAGISLIGEGTASGSRAGWKACNPGIDVIPSGTVPATFLGILDGPNLTVSAFANLNTTLTGISTSQFTVDITDGTPQTVGVDLGPPRGTLCPHTSYGGATITPVQSFPP
jgi:hypothetical protein